MLSVKAHAPVIWDRPAIVTETIPVNGLGTGERARATDPVGSGRPQHQQAVVDWLRPVQAFITLPRRSSSTASMERLMRWTEAVEVPVARATALML